MTFGDKYGGRPLSGLARLCSLAAAAALTLGAPVNAQAPAPAAPAEAPTAPPLGDLGTAPSAGTTPAPSAPQLTGPVAQISVIHKGGANISNEAIKAVMSLKVGDPYTAAAADKDRAAVKDMGYFNGDVVLDATQDPAGGVDLTVTVAENPVVKEIRITANTPSGQPTISADTLKGLMETKEGRVLNINALKRDITALFDPQTGYMRSKGFIVDVSKDINIDPNNGVLTIPLIETHIDQILIEGNKKTKAVVLTRELTEKAGDVLDENKLQKDLTRIYNLGLFEEVGPYRLEPTDVGLVTVVIPVTEKRSGQVSVGIGYSSRSKLVGRAELSENNFRGLGERVSLLWEVGGVNNQSSKEVSFSEPYLDRHHTSLDADIYSKVIYRFNTDSFGSGLGSNNTYTETHAGGSLGLSRPLSDTRTVGLTFRSETVRANDAEVDPQNGFIRTNGNVTVLGARYAVNTRDNNLSPAAGGFASFSYEAGLAHSSTVGNVPSPLEPGRHTISKIGIDLRRYISLQGPRKPGNFRESKRVFAARLLLGFANRDLPFFEQYFLGGADTLRAYDTDQFWGNKLALLQTELRIPFGKSDDFQWVILADAGDAWGSIYQGPDLNQHDKFHLSTDYGVGVRLTTPIGPIRLDYAIGGHGGGRTQFSIGQSF